ncbi:protein BTG3 isoform X3 [Latimeria chalumnae]|uniref:protein BTG3 isoform X3 n=1 Tax=Latimeria chalumnae TaxID=7897 RepID=UPI00313D37A8
MKNEIAAAVFFLMRLIKKNEKLKKEEVEIFAEKLTEILQEKYKNHWYPEKPTRGQAYRYGEKNHAFTVVTFESDEDDQDDIPKKVSHAVDKVTSDYHSGSSSDEESGTKETRPTCWTAKSSAQYQVADYLYQPMLMYQFPRKKPGMFKGNDQLLPHFAHRFQQQGRNSKAFHQPPWLLSAARSDRYHWVHPQNLAHAH